MFHLDRLEEARIQAKQLQHVGATWVVSTETDAGVVISTVAISRGSGSARSRMDVRDISFLPWSRGPAPPAPGGHCRSPTFRAGEG